MITNSKDLFRLRKNMILNHGLLVGETGSGKTYAIKKEIESILETTDDFIIVLDNDGTYQEFCLQHNGVYINITSIDIPSFVMNRFVVLHFNSDKDYKRYEFDNFNYIANAAKGFVLAEIMLNRCFKTTWLYIDSIFPALHEQYLTLMQHRRQIIVTLVTDQLSNSNSEYFEQYIESCTFIRLYRLEKDDCGVFSQRFSIDRGDYRLRNIFNHQTCEKDTTYPNLLLVANKKYLLFSEGRTDEENSDVPVIY